MKMEKWRGRVDREMVLVVVIMIVIVICTQMGFIIAATDPNDTAALKAMYFSLNSPGQLTQWSANGDDPCGQLWKGITCSGSRVTEIQLSGLRLSGSMGFQLTSLTSLTNLDMSNNNLQGNIPYQLPPNAERINLASNQFTGTIPYVFHDMTSLKYLNLGNNQLNGQLNDMFGQLSSLSTLDFSFNSLSGDLPESFSSLSSMNSMYLQNNQLTGPIDVLANLPLLTLDAANNHFTGWIPAQLKKINLQTDGNNFNTGPAPPPPPGAPPPPNGHNSGGNNNPTRSGSGSNKSGIGGGGIAGIIISILVVGAAIAFIVLKRRSRRSSSDIEKVDNQSFNPLPSNEEQEVKNVQASATADTKIFDAPVSMSLKPPPLDIQKSCDEDDFSEKPVVVKKPLSTPINVTSYSVADLQMATNSFSIDHLLGEGSVGRVYRAHFDDGNVVAVKKIDSAIISGEMSEDFIQMVSRISELRHPNLSELVGYCSEHGQHLLVYEFHKNGSLHDLLHLPDEYSKPLIWNSRVKIALGTARALEYLHEVCSHSIIHKNIKSANILLDNEFNPHLSDSGLFSFLPNSDQVLSNNAGSGYGAPEVAMSGQLSLKSDVYSFGVVMLELLTGRKPFDSSRPRSEQSLVRWATPQLHDIDALSKTVDPALEGLYPVKSLSRFANVIALCVQAEPEFRPPMSEVVEALVRLVQRANMSKRTISGSFQPPSA